MAFNGGGAGNGQRGHLGDGDVGPYDEDDDDATEVRRLRRSVAAEVVIALVVLAITALLVNAAPARTVDTSPISMTLKSSDVWVDVVIAPLVGVDPGRYRLGYGGGFFDRTLAALPGKPLVIGVGYEMQRIPTIYPQPHDFPMDLIVTETP